MKQKNGERNDDKTNDLVEQNLKTEEEENLITKGEDLPTTKSEVVYITKTGTKYHSKYNCTKGTYYTTTLEDAKRNGYTICKKCIN